MERHYSVIQFHFHNSQSLHNDHHGECQYCIFIDLNLGIYSFEDVYPHKVDIQLFLPVNKLSNILGFDWVQYGRVGDEINRDEHERGDHCACQTSKKRRWWLWMLPICVQRIAARCTFRMQYCWMTIFFVMGNQYKGEQWQSYDSQT